MRSLPRAYDSACIAVLTGVALSIAATARPAGAAFPAVIPLGALDGSAGFSIPGLDHHNWSGSRVARAGDLNHDGVGDFAIGAIGAGPGNAYSGATYVVFGKKAGAVGAFPATFDLATLDGANGFRIDGEHDFDRSGSAIASAGDINGDGLDDLLIGAPEADPGGRSNAGSSYVVFGRDTAAAGLFPAFVSLSTLNGANGFRLDGLAPGDTCGQDVASARDFNGDGISDIIIGAPYADPDGRSGAGSSYVVFGKVAGAVGPFPAAFDLAALDGVTGLRIDGAAVADLSGFFVAPAGDVNGDGVADLILGAPNARPNGLNLAGSAYVVFGKRVSEAGPFPPALNVSTLDGANGFRLDGVAAIDQFGGDVAGAGDVNGDSLDDIIIGAVNADPNGNVAAGSAYVVFGKNTSAAGAFPATIPVSTLDGLNGFRVDGAARNDRAGGSVASGDVNGDGLADLVVGAASADPGAITNAGSAYVVFGRDATSGPAFSAAIQLAGLDGVSGFRLDGAASQDHAGTVSAGDINGDGAADIIVGAFNASAGGHVNAGSSYVVFGKRAPCAGDANGDGVVDMIDLNIVLSAFGETQGQPGYVPGADLNHDGVVDFLDLNIVLSFFGSAC